MSRRLLPCLIALFLAACASYGGMDLVPGTAREEDVIRTMGAPALRWRDADGSQQLAYPRGPAGFETYMVRIGPDGRLRSVGNVLDAAHLAAIRPGMGKEEVLRVLGPPDPGCTVYFKARDELAWDWRYRSSIGEPMRMIVLFDNTLGTVRSTMTQPERRGIFAGC